MHDSNVPGAAHNRFGATELGLILMALIWGINYSVVKAGLAVMEPMTFNGLRVLLAAIVLVVIGASVRGTPLPPRRDVLALVGLGLVGNGMYQLLFILGMARTRAGIAALIFAASPAWIAMISRLVRRERLSSRGWFGIGLQLVGVALVVGSASAVKTTENALLGALLIASGSIMWAIFSVLLQPYTLRAHPLHLSAITMASGATLLVAFALPGIGRLDFGAVPLAAWGSVVYAGIGALVVAYLLFYNGVRVIGATRTAMYGNLQPVIALVVAMIALGERPTVWQIAGATCIMGGLLISRTARVRSAPARALNPSLSSPS